MKLTRRNFVKLAGMAGLVVLTGGLAGCGNRVTVSQNVAEADKFPPADKATVYFSKTR